MTIKRITGKETGQYTRQEYEDIRVASPSVYIDRIGEVVIDIGTSPQFPSAWIANATGHLNPLGGAGGGFGEIMVDGQSLVALENPTIDIAAADVQFCGDTRKTVGIELIQPTATDPGRLEFRVTPTGVPIDNPFSANADFGLAAPDFQTLGAEIGANWVWDLQKNPLAGIQCFDLGLLP